jgi:hypothetical protein
VQRYAARLVILSFVVQFLAAMWPVYPVFNRIHPFVFGIPLSFFYATSLMALSFVTLLAFHLWWDRSDDEPH